MKLDPEPRQWEALAGGGGEEPLLPPEPEEDEQTSGGEANTSEDEGGEPDPDAVDTGSDSEPEQVAGFPHGYLLERYTYQTECIICGGNVLTCFYGEREAACLLQLLIQRGSINPTCTACMVAAAAEIAQREGQQPETPPASPEPADGEQQHGGQ